MSNDKFPIRFEKLHIVLKYLLFSEWIKSWMFIRKALLDNGTRNIVISCILGTFLRIGGGWHIAKSRSIKTNLIIFANTRMSTIGVPSMQISREEMKSDPLKFVLQLFPTRFSYHYHRSDGSLAYFDQME
jgi:hypothetical protein